MRKFEEGRMSARLRLVASFVEQGSRIADVGTDHGYIPVYLADRGVIASAVAMDVRRGPLERAKEHLEEYGPWPGCEVTLRLSDGVRELRPEEADTVIIAGMGGELVMRIMDEGRHMWGSVERWILSPQSDLFAVRRFLADKGFRIADEAMVIDEGKFYTVMAAERGQMAYEKAAYYRFGKLLIERRDAVLKEYLRRERLRLEGILERMERAEMAADGVCGENMAKEAKAAPTAREQARRERLEELSWIEEAEYEMQ